MKKVIFIAAAMIAAAMPAFGTAVVDDPVLTGDDRLVVDATWCSLGTSITWYNNNVSAAFTKGYQTRVMEQVLFRGFANVGVNAGCVSSAIGAVPSKAYDLYTIEHGINDWGNNIVPGTLSDYSNNTGNNTFAANYRKVIDKIRAVNPNAKIILCTPRKGYGFNGYLPSTHDARQPNGYYLKDYVDIVNAIAATEGFVVADFYSNCGEQNELADLSIDVALHPNDAGHQKMANELVRALMDAYPSAQTVGEYEPVYTDDGTPRIVRVEKFLDATDTTVLEGTELSKVHVCSADMGGSWIPGGPFPCEVYFENYDENSNTYTCQLQSCSPEDDCMRVIGIQLSQDFRGDVTAKILWVHYKFTCDVYGVDYSDMANCDGTSGIATSYSSSGYGIGKLVLSVNGAEVFPEVDLPLDTEWAGDVIEVPCETTVVPFQPAADVLLFQDVKLADVVGFKAKSMIAFGGYAFATQNIDTYYSAAPTAVQNNYDYDGFYNFSRTQCGAECWANVQVETKANGYDGNLLGWLNVRLVQVGDDVYGQVADAKYLYGSNYGVDGSNLSSANSVRYYGDGDDLAADRAVLNFSLRDFSLVVADKTYISVKVVGFGGETIKTIELPADGDGDASAEKPSDASMAVDGYRFVGWDREFTGITGSVTIHAIYHKYFNVVFKDLDDSVLSEQIVEEGCAAEAPAVAATDANGRPFRKWTSQFVSVYDDLVIYPQYSYDYDPVLSANGVLTETDTLLFPGVSLDEITSVSGRMWAKYRTYSQTKILSTEDDPDGKDGIYHLERGDGVLVCQFQLSSSAEYGYTITVMKLELSEQPDGIHGRVLYTKGGSGNYHQFAFGKDYDSMKSMEVLTAMPDYETLMAASGTEYRGMLQDISIGYKPIYDNYLVTFLDESGSVVGSPQIVARGGDAVPPVMPTSAARPFAGWSGSYTNVTDDLVLSPVYHSIFTVQFVDEDGTELKSEDVEEGSAATAPDMTGRTDGAGVPFSGWSRNFSAVDGNMIIIARYGAAVDPSPFENAVVDDDQLLFPGVRIGDIQGVTAEMWAKYNGSSQTRVLSSLHDPDAEGGVYFYTYDSENGKITCQFQLRSAPSYNNCITVMKLELTGRADGVHGRIVYTKGGSGTYAGYAFGRDYDNVTSGVDLSHMHAMPSVEDYNKPNQGGTIYTEYRGMLRNLTIDYRPVFPNYVVRFLDKDGKATFEPQLVARGDDAVAPANTAVAGYKFIRWDCGFTDVTEDIDVPSVYHKWCTVTFVDITGDVLDVQTVEETFAATAPDMTGVTYNGDDFLGWDAEFSCVTDDLTVRAVYEQAAIGPVDTPLWVSGLLQGKIGVLNDFTTDFIASSLIPAEIVPGTVMADFTADGSNYGTVCYTNQYTGTRYHWNASNTTFGYIGQVYLAADDSINFAKNFDDSVFIAIDGTEVMRNLTYNEYPVCSYDSRTTGWHEIEIRLSDGTNGKGPVDGSIAPLGLAYNVNGAIRQDLAGWSAVRDAGNDGCFLRTEGTNSFLRLGRVKNTDGDLTVELGAAGMTGASKLCAFYGVEDGGDSPVGWTHCITLASAQSGDIADDTYTLVGVGNNAAVRFGVVCAGSASTQGCYQFSPLKSYVQKTPLASVAFGDDVESNKATVRVESLGENAESVAVQLVVSTNEDFSVSQRIDLGDFDEPASTNLFLDLTAGVAYYARVEATADNGAVYVSEIAETVGYDASEVEAGDTLTWAGGAVGTWDETTRNWLANGAALVAWVDGCKARFTDSATITLAGTRSVSGFEVTGDVTLDGNSVILTEPATIVYGDSATLRFENDLLGTVGLNIAAHDEVVCPSVFGRDVCLLEDGSGNDMASTEPAVWFRNVRLADVGNIRGTMYAKQGSSTPTLTFDAVTKATGSSSVAGQVFFLENDGETLTAEFQMQAYMLNYMYCVKIELTQDGDDVLGRVVYRKYSNKGKGVGEESWDGYPAANGEGCHLYNLQLIKTPSLATEIAGDCRVTGELAVNGGVLRVVGTGTMFGGDYTASGSSVTTPLLIGDNGTFEFDSSADQMFAMMVNARNAGNGYSTIKKTGSKGRFVIGPNARSVTLKCSSEGMHRMYGPVDIYGTVTLAASTYHLIYDGVSGMFVYDGGVLNVGTGYSFYGHRGARVTCYAGGVVNYTTVESMGAADTSLTLDGGTANITADYAADNTKDIAQNTVTLKNGAEITGTMMTFGWNRTSGNTLTVDGTNTCLITLEKLRFGQNDCNADSKRMVETLNVNDVTGDEDADLVVSSELFINPGATWDADSVANLGFVKNGAGTLLFTGRSPSFGGSVTLNAGALAFGPEAELKGAAFIMTDDVAIELESGAEVSFLDCSGTAWPAGKTLTVDGPIAGHALRFGTDADGLTAAQLSAICYEGRFNRVFLNEHGYLRTKVPVSLIFR